MAATSKPRRRLSPVRGRLLQGASVVVVATALGSSTAFAQLAALRGAAHLPANGAGVSAVAVPVVPGLSTGSAMTTALNRSLTNAANAQAAVNMALQAQTAARQAAAALPSSVPNGLAVGGLMPVANPVPAASDPMGLNTWQNVNLPTQTTAANGAVTVTVQQTAPTAIASWTTFNIGANTTLNFNQSVNGVAEPSWIVLNRVVGQLDPTTGLRNPNLAPAPSQILGAIKSQGTVLVINQNGIIFGPTAQINTNSVIATSLEIGQQTVGSNLSFQGSDVTVSSTISQRDNTFLTSGLLEVESQGGGGGGGTSEKLSGQEQTSLVFDSSGTLAKAPKISPDPLLEGEVVVEAGAQITSGQGGFIILAAPTVTNSGVLTSSQGQVSLAAGQIVNLTTSTGAAASTGQNPNVRGLIVASQNDIGSSFSSDFVDNTATGLIQAPEGYASLTATNSVINAGTITASTSVSRNGFIQLSADNISLTSTSVLAITPDDADGTLPQDPTSLANFKPSQITIGNVDPTGNIVQSSGSDIDIQSNSLIYAPNANIYIGQSPQTSGSALNPVGSKTPGVFIDSGAVIDASGLKNVQIPASQNLVTFVPVVTANDTADSPTARALLDNAPNITVDTRLSGVSPDGVAWVGSPLLPAGALAQQIPVSASQLMTSGGNVVIGAGASASGAPNVVIKPGAVVDISGGWVTFAAGQVTTTQLIDASGAIIPIGAANPQDTYVGIYNGFAATQPVYGITNTFANPLLSGSYFQPAYTQGADAGSLTLGPSSQILPQGTIYASAFTGPLQAQAAQVGTATSTVPGDLRNLQAVGTQLPVGGFLFIGGDATALAGGDVEIMGGPAPTTASGLTFGQPVSVNGSGQLVVTAAQTGASAAAASAAATGSTGATPQSALLTLSADTLSDMGLGQLSIRTLGAVTVDSGADLTLAPGGVFTALANRTITVNGNITAPSGTINLQTVGMQAIAPAGSFDVVVNGQLSTAGLWTNDDGAAGDALQGPGYINGGSISITAAANLDSLGPAAIASVADTIAGTAPVNTDTSGSILIDGPKSLLNVSAGGYVSPNGTLTLTAKGGDVTLLAPTAYFPYNLADPHAAGTFGGASRSQGDIPGFRVNGISDNVGDLDGPDELPINPSAIAARVAIGDGTIQGYGFSGGGTFTLETPSINFASGIAASGTNLPLDFFSKAGFSAYNITSYATDLIPNAFTNGFGGYNAVLATQVLTVQNGQTLNLTQTGYSPQLTGSQISSLRVLASGGQLSSIVAPSIKSDAFDQRPVSLNLGGLIELQVASGGQVTGAAGASLSASQIYNMGRIRLPGGTLSQSEALPESYAGLDDSDAPVTVYSAPSLSDIFSTGANGAISETAPSLVNPSQTNAQVAANAYIYLTGTLPASVGIELAPGSVTDLSGTALINPFAAGVVNGRQIITGSVVGGGTLQTATPNNVPGSNSFLTSPTLTSPTLQPGQTLVAAPGSTINLSGAAATFDQLTAGGQDVSSPQWSSGGSLIIGAGETLTGANIQAQGGAPQAAGGVLNVQGLTLTAVDPATPSADTVSAQQIQSAGFGTLVVQGDLKTSGGPVDLTLGQAFFLQGAAVTSLALTSRNGGAPTAPTIGTTDLVNPVVSVAGSLQINAPYIGLDGAFQNLLSPSYSADAAKAATGDVVFNAQALDVTGAVLFDQAVAKVTLQASGDLRLIGVAPFQVPGQATVSPSLVGQLAVNGDLTLSAAQVYATTGSSFYVSSTAKAGTITIAPAATTTPATPYSAGSNLTIQAANIVQNGDLQAPVGSLTLGANTPLALTPNLPQVSGAVTFAPATASVTLGDGSVTSVSAGGLSIPYGTTTDQKEYFFTPTNANPLTAPPAATLTLAGQTITTATGATVNLSGGGDLYAYEFVPGTGGSRDILNQFNADVFTSNNGFQFPGGTQVYAIVPGLSNAAAAAYDPIYSANYSPLYAPSMVGERVYLNAGPGVAAGWYTLLPAQYALLPGGMEVVQDTTAKSVAVGASTVQNDGTVEVTGQFGGLGGAVQSTPVVFDVKSQAVIAEYSQIAQTSADTYFTNLAAANAITTPRLPTDAGSLVISPAVLNLNGAFETAPATGGRGADVDITGADIQIVAQTGAPIPGVIQLSASQLDRLNADSLLIGGVRTDNADGTTTLDVTASQITVANSAATPLTAPDIVLAVDGSAGAITLQDGATLTATGTDLTSQTGAYIINGATPGQTGQGAMVEVSTGPLRLVTRETPSATAAPGVLTVGAARLSGTSLLLDSSGDFSLSPSASLSAANIGLDASAISFAPSAQGLTGLVITPGILASFGAANLTLRSPGVISFTSGAYNFGALNLDSPGVALAGGTGALALNATGAVRVQDSAADAGDCTAGGALACGTGLFSLTAQSLTFGDGTFRIYGAGQGVTLTAPDGVFVQGQGALNVGAAPLTIQTAYLGDQAVTNTVGTPAELPSLAITTTGALTIANAAGAKAPTVTGVPGSSLTLSGQSISVSGVDVRATAGSLTLTSATGIGVGAGATLETPGFSESFGDAADPFSESAPGGLLTLTALNGDIALAGGSTLSVGGGTGVAGSLTLNAGQGTVTFGGTLNGSAPTGGAGFTLNEAGAFDLSGFETATKGVFDGNVAVETGAGGLTLAAGQTLTAANVSLTADAGLVDIAGTINVNGVNGGNVGLYGAAGVTLENAALISARASGYGANNDTQAQGGQIVLGTTGTGALTVASGAVIDVSAAQTTARAVETVENGVVNYEYVPADLGGTVTLRAPVSGGDGAETVNVNFAGAIKGASSITLEGFKAYDLGAIAASGQFSGVTVAGGVATLSTTATTGNLPNFLASDAAGTLVDFIQNFNVSASYANLGGLAALPGFHAQPGVELDYSGAVTLASNWNLGAGTVNVPAAVAAGLMVADPSIPGGFAVIPGDEAAVFSNYTNLTYRVGGSVLGQPGMLTIKAGGQLNIDGSITDGFFTFADQTDPNYLAASLGIGNNVFNGELTPVCVSCAAPAAYSPATANATSGVSLSFPSTLPTMAVAASANPIPYDAAANTPGALGSGAGGAGDPIGSAEIFPLVQTAAGPQAVSSWSYQLSGGAVVGGANPLAVRTGATGGVTVQGVTTYSYGGKANDSLSNTLLFSVGGQQVNASQFEAAEIAANPKLTDQSLTKISLTANATEAKLLQAQAVAFFADHPGQFTFTGPAAAPTAVSTSLALASGFLEQVSSDWAALKAGYTAPAGVTLPTVTAQAPTLIRTGAGSIALAAAGDINLQNGAPTYVNPTTGATSQTPVAGDFQQGGATVYTAGQMVIPAAVTAIDTTTGAPVALNPAGFATTDDFVGVQPYGYGAALQSLDKGAVGVLVANPVYLDNGGNVSLSAGGDVLGRSDQLTPARVGAAVSLPGVNANGDPGLFTGEPATPWLVGGFSNGSPSQGSTANILVNPQLFSGGVGALGGGDISVTAGHNISDLTVVAGTTMTTAAVTGPGVAAGQSSLGLLTYGGGDVAIVAGGNLLGGRLDVGSGVATVAVGGSVMADGALTEAVSDSPLANTLRIDLANAQIALTAGRSVEIQGVSNILGSSVESGDALGFYSATSGLSVISNGSIAFDNPATSYVVAGGVVTDQTPIAIFPGSLQAVSLEGDLNLAQDASLALAGGQNVAGASTVLLTPSATGTLTLAAGADVDPVNLAMLDNDPGQTPGLFSSVTVSVASTSISGGLGFTFPNFLPTTTTAQRQQQHDASILHLNDPAPNRIYAGGDIDSLVLSVPKQTRIGAGQDIVDMMFFGQNINSNDITRIVAGRDITATTQLEEGLNGFNGTMSLFNDLLPTVQGNSFIIGGPGSFWLEAGRNLGPFLTSVNATEFLNGSTVATQVTYGGGVISVGNSYDPYLTAQGANLYVEFGVAKGQDFDALLNYYLNPANMANLPDYLFSETLNANNVFVPDKSQPIYAPQLIAYMQANQAAALIAAFGTTNVSYAQAYTAFAALPALQQRPFLLQVYYSELSLTSVPGPTFQNYTRGYTAVNLLFPSSLGYTANNLGGGTNGANATVETGDLDLRLATIQTQFGGNIDILGPGGEVLAGSTVATAQQAARRNSEADLLYGGNTPLQANGNPGVSGVLGAADVVDVFNPISSIPASFEGILTLRGGNISGFTDGSLVLNQSRLFTEEGGNIILWSSNADLDAGEGPKTSSDFPPVQVLFDGDNGYSVLDASSDVTGAGIGAFQPSPDIPAPTVYLVAPRGTVNFGAAGARVAGDLFVAALHVTNAANVQVGGTAIGLPPAASVVNIGAQNTNATAAATKQMEMTAVQATAQPQTRVVITVDVLGFGETPCPPANRACRS